MEESKQQNPLLEPMIGKDHSWEWKQRVEKPWYREAIGLAAQGFTHKEIGEITGRHRAHVSRVLAQPENEQRLLRVVTHNVVDEIKNLVEKTASASIVRLAEMAEDENLKFKHPKLFVDINQSFVDRLLGKATTVIEERRSEPTKLSDEELAANIARLESRVGTPE